LTKEGPARYLSHSEYSRAILFAARRSALPLGFTGEHRPRLKVSLSPPLPIGITSECELVDLQLIGYVPAAEAEVVLSRAFTAGIKVVFCRLMGADEKPVGKLIDTATYRVTLPEGYGAGRWRAAATEYIEKDRVLFERVQPRKTRTLDLRPGTHRLEVETDESAGAILNMTLDDGISGTVKPWEVVEVLASYAGVPEKDWKRAGIHRNGLFARRGEKLVSPMEAGAGRPAVTRRGGRRF
jgi:radical SAM-linked protein